MWHKLSPLLFFLLFLALLLGVLAPARGAVGGPVSACLVLLVDTSGSISGQEFEDQRDDTAAALASDQVIRAVQDTPLAAIAVTLVLFSGETNQRQAVPWRRLETVADHLRFSLEVRAAQRTFSDWTALGSALQFAGDVLDACPWAADRRVVDLSADGISNNGPPVRDARDDLAARGVTVNVLAISDEVKDLPSYMEQNVVVGPAGFVVEATHASYADAIRRKLVLELF